MGISIDENTHGFRVQNRSHFVNSKSHEQFRKLDAWLERNGNDLRKVIIPGRTILYGEWLFAQHSVAYTRLPDTFLVFDIYDALQDRFLSRAAIAAQLAGTSLHQVPEIFLPSGSTPTVDSIMAVATGTQSIFYDGSIEGIYLRRERDGYVIDRAKVVRRDFIAGNDHWTKGNIKQNGVVFVTATF